MEVGVRIGVVGGGIRGSMFGSVIREHPRGALVGFCDPSPGARTSLTQRFGVPVHEEVGALIAEGLDALVVATPDFAHLEAGLAGLRAGLHVLFEKPLATTLPDALALSEAAEASPGQVMVGFENRWNPKFQMVREMLREAATPLIAQRVLLQDTEFVPRRMLSWAGKSSPAWFLMPHTLDLAMWISGAEPVEVFARGVRKVLVPDGIDTYDRIAASFLLSDGSILDLDSGWVLPESRPSVFQFRYGLEAKGLEFDIEIDRSGVTSFDASGVRYLGGPETDLRGRLLGPHIDMMRDFIDLCAGAEIDHPTIAQGLLVTRSIHALHESLETRTNVAIS